MVLVVALSTCSMGTARPQRQAGKSVRVLDVCTALNSNTRESLAVRGIGSMTIDGFILGDATCPVAERKEVRIPGMILVEIKGFATRAQKVALSRAEPRGTRTDERGTYFQALIEGELDCARPFDVKRSDRGDLMSGSGFGDHGFVKCVLRNAHVIELHELR